MMHSTRQYRYLPRMRGPCWVWGCAAHCTTSVKASNINVIALKPKITRYSTDFQTQNTRLMVYATIQTEVEVQNFILVVQHPLFLIETAASKND